MLGLVHGFRGRLENRSGTRKDPGPLVRSGVLVALNARGELVVFDARVSVPRVEI